MKVQQAFLHILTANGTASEQLSSGFESISLLERAVKKIVKKIVTTPSVRLATALLLAGVSALAQNPTPAAPAVPTVLGEVSSVDAAARGLKIKIDDGSTLAVTMAEKGTVVKVAPGEKSLQNAAPIAFDAITAGDRVLVRGGARAADRLEGALRVVVMARTDLAARNEEEQRAWRERGVSGTVTEVDTAKGEFTVKMSGTATPTVVVEASKAVMHRYADTSVKFDDAKAATVAEIAIGDQARLLGKRSEDGNRIAAEKVVFGSFRTMALAIEKIDTAAGVLSVKDLETNKKFTLSITPGGSIRKIPAEMGAMFAMMSGGGGRPGGAPGAGGMGGGRPQGEGGGMGGRPGGGGAMGAGAPPQGAAAPGGMPAAGRAGGPGRGNRGDDMVDRLPVVTLADLKKDDWIGAVVGRTDASGRAVAFNVLAGIEVFAARANRGGGVDVGMPAGLLDGAFGVP